MTRYTIMLKHPTIAQSRTVCVDSATLGEVKRRAMQEFGDEFQDYRIVIYLHPANGDEAVPLVSRRVGGNKWNIMP